jgi:hypothetical protein
VLANQPSLGLEVMDIDGFGLVGQLECDPLVVKSLVGFDQSKDQWQEAFDQLARLEE